MSPTVAYFVMVNFALVVGAVWGYFTGKRAHEYKFLDEFKTSELRAEIERREAAFMRSSR